MLNHQFGYDKSVPEAARNVRPFCKSCHMSLAQAAPTCLLCTVSVSGGPPGSHLYTPRVNRGSQRRDWGRTPQVSGQKAIESSACQPLSRAQCLPGIFSFNPHNNPRSSGVPTLPNWHRGAKCVPKVRVGGRMWTQAAGLQVHLPMNRKGHKALGALKKGEHHRHQPHKSRPTMT